MCSLMSAYKESMNTLKDLFVLNIEGNTVFKGPGKWILTLLHVEDEAESHGEVARGRI